MTIVGIPLGLLLLVIVLWDTFETIVLPRTVSGRVSLTRLFYKGLLAVWRWRVRRVRPGRWRDAYLAGIGPLSLLLLLGVWAMCLILSFALIQWGLGTRIYAQEAHPDLCTDIYLSGSTLFTLGYGDVTPRAGLPRFVSVAEAGVGLGFLALVIGYLPILYQSFSRREVGISMLDARAGSPPSAVELLRRHAASRNMEALVTLLGDWERWSADVLESHLSYPWLTLYRSQHDRESWLAALTAILDACSLILTEMQGAPEWLERLRWQAQLTFAMARHTVVDLSLIMGARPRPPDPDRLPPEEFARLCAILAAAGIPLCSDKTAYNQLTATRRQYEPYVNALADRLFLTLPTWIAAPEQPDNWQTSAFEPQNHFHG